jgi:sporulation protein YlmC with PRC-barrel domain
MAKKEIKVSDLIPDDRNLNKGTQFGGSLIEKSLRKFGAGRSILIDKNNRIIAGNKTVENAAAIGLEDLQIVETDGTKIIAVKRTDIDLDSKAGRELALADNASAKANIDWDIETTFETAHEFGFDAEEWGVNDGGFEVDADKLGEDFTLPDGDKAPFQQMTFTLADEQAEQIKNAIADIKATEEYKYAETMGNENSNGNALYLIVMQWGEQRK